MSRYFPNKLGDDRGVLDLSDHMADLRRRIAEEERLRDSLAADLKDLPNRKLAHRTYWEYANMWVNGPGDYHAAIARVEGRLRELWRQLAEAERRHGRDEADEDLIY